MIRTLKKTVVTAFTNQKYDPNWTYIEALLKCDRKTTTYSFYRGLSNAKTISNAFKEEDIVIDWGDGTVNSESTHRYTIKNKSSDTRIVIKIKNIYKAARYDSSNSDSKTFRDFLDPSKTVGALSIATFGNLPIEDLSLRQLFYDCPIDYVDPKLFENCSNIWDFFGIFCRTKIDTIPEKLFLPCKAATSVQYAFANILPLKSFPVTLFDTCTKLTEPFYFDGVFQTSPLSDLFKFIAKTVGKAEDELKDGYSYYKSNKAISNFFANRMQQLKNK